MDLTNCINATENVISIGNTINGWGGMNNHLYYTQSSKELKVYYSRNGGEMNNTAFVKTLTSNIVEVELNNEGLFIDGELLANSTPLSGFNNPSVGSQEGGTRSYATYLYIKTEVDESWRITKDITPNTVFTANTLDLADTQFQNVKFLCTTDIYNLKVPTTMKNFYCDSAMDIDTDVIEDASYEVIHEELIEHYTTNYEGEVCSVEDFTLSLPTYAKTVPTNDRSRHTDLLEVVGGTEYITTIDPGAWECVTFYASDKTTVVEARNSSSTSDPIAVKGVIPKEAKYLRFSSNANITITITFKIKKRKKTTIENLELATSSGVKPGQGGGAFLSEKIYTGPNSYYIITPSDFTGLRVYHYDSNDNKVMEYVSTNTYESTWAKGVTGDNVAYIIAENSWWSNSGVNAQMSVTYTTGSPTPPNLIPSSANGSLIFNMYSNNTAQPTSTSPYMWDLTGLKLEDFYTYGMNNWVKPSEDSYVKIGDYTNLVMLNGKYTNQINIGYYDGGQANNRIIGLFQLDAGTHTFATSTGNPPNVLSSNSLTGSVSNHFASAEVTTTETRYFLIYTGTDRKWVEVDGYRYYFNDIYYINNTTNGLNLLDYSNNQSCVVQLGKKVFTGASSITMPQRMSGYSVRLVNADITPDEYPTHLYPLLVDTTLPITGKLDYTKYNGTSLAWAFAYTTDDVDINPLDSRSQGNITQDYNKLYGTDYVDIIDVWVYKDTDLSKFSTNDKIKKIYIELSGDKENIRSRFNEVLAYYPNCDTIYAFDDGTANLTQCYLGNYCSAFANQIKHFVFMDGYFQNLQALENTFLSCKSLESITNIPNTIYNMQSTFSGCVKLTTIDKFPSALQLLGSCFNSCSSLVTVPTIPSSVIRMVSCFYNCSLFNQQLDLSNFNIDVNHLEGAFQNCSSLTTPPILPSNYTGTMKNCFQGCSSLTTAPTIPDGVTDMQNCFMGCSKLTKMSNIPSSVSNTSSCFQGCSSLVNTDTSNCDTSNVQYMSNMFNGSAINPSVLSKLDLSSVTHMTSIFQHSIYKGEVNISNINAPKLTNMNGFMHLASGITKVIMHNWNTPMLTHFYNPSGFYLVPASYIDLSGIDGSTITELNILTYNHNLVDFYPPTNISCNFSVKDAGNSLSQDSIKRVMNNLADLASEGKTATLTLGDTYGAYLTPDEVFSANAKGWTIVGASNDFTIVNASDDVSGYTTDENVLSCFIELTNANYLTRIDEVLQWYPNCTDLYLFEDGSMTTLKEMFRCVNIINNYTEGNNRLYYTQIQNITFVNGYFENCTSLDGAFPRLMSLVSINNIPNSVTNMNGTFVYDSALTRVDFPSSLVTMDGTFDRCSGLLSVGTIPSSVTVMRFAFQECTSLEITPNIPDGVTNMQNTFYGCSKLTTAPNIPNGVTNMQNTFNGCTSLTTVPNIPSSVTTLSYTFRGCTALTTIDTTNWDISNVTALDGLFYGCGNLVKINGIENWNTSKVTGVWDLFFGCGSLTDIDLSKWDMSKMSSTGAMYRGCGSLKTAYLPIQNGTPNNALAGCSSDLDIIWVGERSSDFNIGVYGHSGFREEDIQELVPEHLGDLHKDEIKISFSNKKITINNTETTWE